jgi:regulator of cell morphogenesis and NO signaling
LNRIKAGGACLRSDRAMPDAETPELIAHIVERFHESHRRDLPALVALARELGEAGAELAAHLASMGQALELHMFKEEMRLFPMMEQGGNTLMGLLVDELLREHRAHEDNVARLEALVRRLTVAPAHGAGAAALRAGVARFVADLAEHVRLEDEVLFPRFAAHSRVPIVLP